MENVTKRKPSDYVIATGRQESVKKFIEIAADKLGWKNEKNKSSIIWQGKFDEIGRRADTGEIVIRIDPRYFRPCEVETLLEIRQKPLENLAGKHQPH